MFDTWLSKRDESFLLWIRKVQQQRAVAVTPDAGFSAKQLFAEIPTDHESSEGSCWLHTK